MAMTQLQRAQGTAEKHMITENTKCDKCPEKKKDEVSVLPCVTKVVNNKKPSLEIYITLNKIITPSLSSLFLIFFFYSHY